MNRRFNLKQLGIFLLLLLLFFVLLTTNSFSNIQSTLSDNLHGGKQTFNNIVLVEIDDQSIQELGRWPWDRDIFAQLLSKVESAKVVGVDVSFFEKSPHDQALSNQIESMDNLVLAAEYNNNILFKPIFPAPSGYVNLVTDRDGVTRSLTKGLTTESIPFSFQVFQKYTGQELTFRDRTYFINFAASPGTFASYSTTAVLNNDYDFKNKLVLIGATAPDLHDNYFVPTSNGVAMPGVEIHAHIIQNLILNNFLHYQNKYLSFFLITVFAFVSMFYISRLKIYYTPLILIGFYLVYLFLAIILFNQLNYVLDVFYLPLAVLVFTGMGVGLNYIQERKHNLHLTTAFGKYISKDLLKEIIEHKHQLKLGGTKREITIFFSDIRGFTSISEKLKPEDLVRLLNEYLTEMTSIILKHQGTVDKFIGDAVMAFWNAPLKERKHAQLACQSALEQIKLLRKLQPEWEKQKLPVIHIGIGIHTGPAVIGNMGSEERFDYTAMGDTINLGSRLEGLTKQYGVDIIASEDTYQKCKKKFIFRKLDRVKVKGKKVPITIHQLCIRNRPEFRKLYEQALELYFKSKFKQALKIFKKANGLEPKDLSAKLFIARCQEYIKHPPSKDWGGAFVMKTK